MIRALTPTPPVIIDYEPTPEERAHALAELGEFVKNVEWFGARAKEIRDAHSGMFICVAGQELFVGDDPIEVCARALTAHPIPGGGFYSKRLSILRGPKVYADQRNLG